MYVINLVLEALSAMALIVLLLCIALDDRRYTTLYRRLSGIMLWDLVVLVSDMISFIANGRQWPYAGAIIRCSNCVLYIAGYMTLNAFTRYLEVLIGGKTKHRSHLFTIVKALCMIGTVLVIVNMFNGMYFTVDENNFYHRESLFWLSQAFGVVSILLNVAISWRYRRVVSRLEQVFLFAYQLLPVTALVLQVFIDGPSFLNIALTLSILIISAGIQVEQSRQLEQKEKELTENRISIMLSQIQPHFLYNALTAIAALCDTAPKKAKAAIMDFSVYLRGNMDSLKQKRPVPFEKELKHTEVYIELEKMRFGQELTVAYDIQCRDFNLPALSIQPIVENAVRYGVGQRENGGTVSIVTRETPNFYQVVITDDGVGYDVNQALNDSRTHVGIENVRHRLKTQCDGTLEIESLINIGTKAVLSIPKRREGVAK